MSRRSMHTSSTTSPSPFRWEMQVPPKATGLIIGKGGATIKSFHNIAGISSVNLSRDGTIQIHAASQEALDTVVNSIVQRVSYHLNRNIGFIPQVTIFCFCKSLQHPLLSIDKLSLERFSGPIPNVCPQSQPQKPHFCFSFGEISQERKNGMVDNADGITSEVHFCLHWDFSAYRAKLRSCLETLIFSHPETLGSMKLILRYGKMLFYSSELQEGVPVAVERLNDLCRRKFVGHKFSAACSDSAAEHTNFVDQLESLGYRKASSRNKIRMQVTDRENSWRIYNVSLRVEGSEQSVAVTKVRTGRRREAFVTFSREGSAATDFRLAIMSYGPEEEAIPEMVQWIENEWTNESPQAFLSGRFMALNMGYEKVDTYLSEDWKLIVGQIDDTDETNPLSYRWGCVSSSRWFNKNAHKIEGEAGLDFALANMEAFVKEGAKLSSLMDTK